MWILPPKVKRGKTSFHFTESWYQCLPALTSAQPSPLGVSTQSHNWPSPCVTCYIVLWLLPPTFRLISSWQHDQLVPKNWNSTSHLPTLFNQRGSINFSISIRSISIISSFTCIVPIIFWFILIQTTKEVAIATWHVSTIVPCDGLCKLCLVHWYIGPEILVILQCSAGHTGIITWKTLVRFRGSEFY